MKKRINHQFHFPHPPEIIWEYLINAELLEQWLMRNTFKPVVGHEFQFITGPIPSLKFDGIFYCQVLEIVPFKKLSYTWRSGPGEGHISVDSTVVWKLEAKDNGTELSLEHSGFGKKENLDMYNGLLNGWLEKFQKIAQHLKNSEHAGTNA